MHIKSTSSDWPLWCVSISAHTQLCNVLVFELNDTSVTRTGNLRRCNKVYYTMCMRSINYFAVFCQRATSDAHTQRSPTYTRCVLCTHRQWYCRKRETRALIAQQLLNGPGSNDTFEKFEFEMTKTFSLLLLCSLRPNVHTRHTARHPTETHRHERIVAFASQSHDNFSSSLVLSFWLTRASNRFELTLCVVFFFRSHRNATVFKIEKFDLQWKVIICFTHTDAQLTPVLAQG